MAARAIKMSIRANMTTVASTFKEVDKDGSGEARSRHCPSRATVYVAVAPHL